MDKGVFLGIELGSTRIKAVLIDENAAVLAQGSYEWENTLVNGFWSYALEDVTLGIQAAYADLAASYATQYKKRLEVIDAVGISAMMHGYLAFDKNERLLTPFRTWRNTNAAFAAELLSKEFSFNVPARWSIAHLYQAILDGEAHVGEIAFTTTLSGYVHYKLTGKKVLGVGDASGMFPIRGSSYDLEMVDKFNAILEKNQLPYKLEAVLPKVLAAGENAGALTAEGALWLDPTGTLKAGAATCPPEGDAGTGMVATNSVSVRTANVSAGTSGFLMVVLDAPLKNYYKEIDVVTTPSGAPVAMVHVNNFASEITAWTNLFAEIVALSGGGMTRGELFDALYQKSLEGDSACGGLIGYNYLSGEPIADVNKGVPMVMRSSDGSLTLANFMKMQIYSALGALSMGMDILRREAVSIESVCGHGGFFKTPFVGQNAMSAAIDAPVTVLENAGEGGAWGIALLAAYACLQKGSLEAFLNRIFEGHKATTVYADKETRADFARFMTRYKAGLKLEKLASEVV